MSRLRCLLRRERKDELIEVSDQGYSMLEMRERCKRLKVTIHDLDRERRSPAF